MPDNTHSIAGEIPKILQAAALTDDLDSGLQQLFSRLAYYYAAMEGELAKPVPNAVRGAKSFHDFLKAQSNCIAQSKRQALAAGATRQLLHALLENTITSISTFFSGSKEIPHQPILDTWEQIVGRSGGNRYAPAKLSASIFNETIVARSTEALKDTKLGRMLKERSDKESPGRRPDSPSEPLQPDDQIKLAIKSIESRLDEIQAPDLREEVLVVTTEIKRLRRLIELDQESRRQPTSVEIQSQTTAIPLSGQVAKISALTKAVSDLRNDPLALTEAFNRANLTEVVREEIGRQFLYNPVIAEVTQSIRNQIAANLVVLSNGKSLRELEAESEVSKSQIAELKKGTSTAALDTFCKLANALHIRPSQLLMANPKQERKFAPITPAFARKYLLKQVAEIASLESLETTETLLPGVPPHFPTIDSLAKLALKLGKGVSDLLP